MPDIAPSRLVGVFEVLAEIEEIGARVGDHLVIGEHQGWPVSLARELSHDDARWAFGPSCALEFTRYSSLSRPDALRHLRDTMGGQAHLTLLH